MGVVVVVGPVVVGVVVEIVVVISGAVVNVGVVVVIEGRQVQHLTRIS